MTPDLSTRSLARHETVRIHGNNARPGVGMHLTAAARRRQTNSSLDELRRAAGSSTAEFLVVHGMLGYDASRIDEMVEVLDSSSPSGRSASATDLCVADTGTDATVSSAWRSLTRHGVRTSAVRTHADPLDPGAAAASDTPPERAMFVVRTSAVLRLEHGGSPAPASQRLSWWAAALCLVAFTVTQVMRVLSRLVPLSISEQRWIATLFDTSNDVPADIPLDLAGSALWPSLLRSSFDTIGVGGVRLSSVALTVFAIGCSAAASSRLFGRWSARLTTAALTIGLLITDVALRATPVALATAGLAVALLGFALADSSDRPTWLLMSGAGAACAVAADHRALVFVVLLMPFLGLTRGRDGWWKSRVYALSTAVCIGAWLLSRPGDATAIGVSHRLGSSIGDVLGQVLVVTASAVGASIVVMALVQSDTVRRRLVATVVLLWALPLSHMLGGNGATSGASLTMAMILVAPAVGGLVAHCIAARWSGSEVVPVQRTTPDLLTVDPSTGRIDGNMIRYTHRQMVAAGVVVAVMAAWFFPWAVRHANWDTPWLSIPFLGANFAVFLTGLLLAFNNSKQSVPLIVEVPPGHEPLVGVIVPTAGEPLDMVFATVRSILDQDWPVDRLRIVVSDDAHSDEFRLHFEAYSESLPDDVLTYFRPPQRGTPQRIGDSKADNMNSAIRLLNAFGCEFVETRDADDLVASNDFLRLTVSQMMLDPNIAFVQTIKESATSVGDPFNNNEVLFYRGMMLSRNADRCSFPCGSGLVWRRAALRDIGNFPVWNLVEDLHSGILALRAGWRGLYVPIVGAYAQHSPEDVANYFKQRGTWALDSVRLMAFDRFRGLPLRLRLHFLEQTAFYLLSIPLMVLMIVPMFSLAFGQFPIEADPAEYALHFVGFAIATELVLLAFATDKPADAFWRTRMFLIGMAPLYAVAVARALWYGAGRKPAYVVTRKTDQHQVYFRMVRTHWFLIALIIGAIGLSARRGQLLLDFDPGAIYWALVGLVGLGYFMRLSWFGVSVRSRVRSRLAVGSGRSSDRSAG